MKATVIADWRGRTLWTDALGPGRMHDATAARNEGIAICFQHFPDVGVLLDDGLPRSEPRSPRASDHTAGETASRSTAQQSRAVGTRPPPALIRPRHRRTRPRRPQTPEATTALDPPPRPPARHLPRHRRPRIRPHRSSLNTGPPTDQHASPATTHQLVRRAWAYPTALRWAVVPTSTPISWGTRASWARWIARVRAIFGSPTRPPPTGVWLSSRTRRAAVPAAPVRVTACRHRQSDRPRPHPLRQGPLRRRPRLAGLLRTR